MASLKSVPAGPPPGSTGPPDVATPTPATDNEQTIANKVSLSLISWNHSYYSLIHGSSKDDQILLYTS